MSVFQKNAKWFYAVMVVLLVLLLCLPLLADPYEKKILPNTYIGNCCVGGMTQKEATQALAPLAALFSQETMVVSLPEKALHLLPEDTGVALDVSAAVKAAYALGRTGSKAEKHADYEASLTHGNCVDLAPYVRLQEDVIRCALEGYAAVNDSTFSESQYTLEGTMPELTEGHISPDPQTLILNLGTPTHKLDIDNALQQIQEAYHRGEFAVTIDYPPQALPKALDLDAIHSELSTAPTDAAVDLESFQILPAAYGYGFDLESAKSQLQTAQYGDTITIPMEFSSPALYSEDLYFRDVLGRYTSGHSDRPNIVKNLQLVCQALNGIIVQPGEIFSFNDAVGERTVERGFMYGESFSGMEVSSSAGGGVCQGSSVLHVCVLEADLEVVERVSHGLPVGYTPLGQDAAVSWGGPDFRFRNNTHFPIKIVAEYTEQDIRFQLLGIDEKDYYIVLEATQGQDENQIYANCIKCKYDKATDQLISRELAVHSAYWRKSR